MDQNSQPIDATIAPDLANLENIPNSPPPPQQPQQTIVIQQVKPTKDLDGVSGWLFVFLIFFALSSLGMISKIIFGIFLPSNTALGILNSIFAPFATVYGILSIALIALGYKFARISAIFTFAISAILVIASAFATMSESASVIVIPNEILWATTIFTCIMYMVIYGLFIFYFLVSRRVKKTLTKTPQNNTLVIVIAALGAFAALLAVVGFFLSINAAPDTDSSDNILTSSIYVEQSAS